MKRAAEILSHPAWQGVGGVSGIISAILAGVMLYLIFYPPPTPPKKESEVARVKGASPVDSSKVNTDPASTPLAPSYDGTEHDANDVLSTSLRSIGPDYRGVHQYLNDWPSFGVLAVVFCVIGIGA